MKFRSIANPHHVYAIGKIETSYAARRHGILCDWAAWYDSMGDGWTAHTPLALIPTGSFADFLWSAALATADNIAETDAECSVLDYRAVLAQFWPTPTSNSRIKFALSVAFNQERYDTGKHQLYSLAEEKVSGSESKRHDRRWEEVPSWAKGDSKSAFMLLNLAGSHDAIEAFALAEQIIRIREEITGSHYGEHAAVMLDHVPERNFDAIQHVTEGFRVVQYFVEAYRAESLALRIVKGRRNSGKLQPQVEEVAS